jgi:hypothetical protein
MLRRTSKRVKEQVDKMLLPAVVRLRTTFWGCTRNYSNELINYELTAMVSTCHRTTLVLDFWDKTGTKQMQRNLEESWRVAHLDRYDVINRASYV